MLSGALSCVVDNGRRQKSYLKQYVKFHLLSYEPGGRSGRRSASNRARRAKKFYNVQQIPIPPDSAYPFRLRKEGSSLPLFRSGSV